MTPPLFACETSCVAVGDTVELTGDEGRHAADVKRMRVGEAVLLGHGDGVLLHGTVAAVARGRLEISVTRRDLMPAPAPRLVVAQALAKGGRDEAAVEAMTEVGVDEVLGWQAQRCVARWTDRTAHRWAATARAAAKQSRRAWWPVVRGPVTTADLGALVRSVSLAVVLDGSADQPLAGLAVPDSGDVLLVVGPEGGITAGERDELVGAGAVPARLGGTVLRASTAGVAALSVLSAAALWR